MTRTSKTSQLERGEPTAIQAPSLVPAWDTRIVADPTLTPSCFSTQLRERIAEACPLEHIADQNFKNSAKMPSTGISRRKLEKKTPPDRELFRPGVEKVTKLLASNLQAGSTTVLPTAVATAADSRDLNLLLRD